MTTPQSVRRPLAKLVPPHADKHWSFQIVNRLPEHEGKVRVCMASPAVKALNPFLQGCSVDWLMVEFWSRDEEAIRAAAAQLAAAVALPLGEGNFTRADLGLEP